VRIEPWRALDVVVRGLRRTAPPPGDIVLVHGDYKPGNALIDGNRIHAILDWETAHLGDPLEDLGWMVNPARKAEQQIAGVWERAQIVEEYSRQTGREVNEDDLRWWIVFACWRLAITNLAGQHAFALELSDRISQTPTWLFRRMFALIEEAG
jgi:aminoglycoside phosphotransferase (APT) family kinase protein